MQKALRGRKNDIKKILKDQGSLHAAAVALDVTTEDFEEYIQYDTELKQLVRENNLDDNQRVENALLKAATGYTAEEYVYHRICDSAGKSKMVLKERKLKHVQPNVEAAKTWLAFRSTRWRKDTDNEGALGNIASTAKTLADLLNNPLPERKRKKRVEYDADEFE